MQKLFDLSGFTTDQLEQLIVEANLEIQLKKEEAERQAAAEEAMKKAAVEYCKSVLEKYQTDNAMRIHHFPDGGIYVITGYKHEKSADVTLSGWAQVNEKMIWETERLIAQEQMQLGTKTMKHIRRAFAVQLLDGDIIKVTGVPTFGHDTLATDFYEFVDNELKSIEERAYRSKLRKKRKESAS